MADAKLPKTSKTYYLPSVADQLRERGLQLLKCNPDGYCMYSALYKVQGGTNESRNESQRIRDSLLIIIRTAPDNVKAKILQNSGTNGSIEDYCWQKETTELANEDTWGDCGMLYTWCYSNNCNVRVYSVHNQTELIQEMTFPGTYPVTFHDSKKRGLFLHGNHYDAVMPISGTCEYLGSQYLIDLWKKFCHHNLQECAICFKENVNLSQSHIIPECMLWMAAEKYVKDNKVINPSKITEKLLCSSSKRKCGYEQMERGCEQMLSSSEEMLCNLLAGSSWKKKDGPTKVKGLIEDVWKAVNSETTNGSVEFTTNMAHRHALISIAYRLLITLRPNFAEKKSNDEIKKMEESLGRLAKKLRNLVVFPYAHQKVHVLLLFSANGTRAFDSPGPELHIDQVVPIEYGSDIVVHFGLRGLNFIVTDFDLSVLLPCILQNVFIISGEVQTFTIPYESFREDNGPFLSQLIDGYTMHKFDPSVAASSCKIDIPEGSSSRELSDCNIIRLPNGFKYNHIEITLQEGNNWTISHEKDMEDEGIHIEMNSATLKMKYYCKKMWILKHSIGGLNAIFAFVSDRRKHFVFGFSLSENYEITGPMFNTNFRDLTITPEMKHACERAIKDFLETLQVVIGIIVLVTFVVVIYKL